MDDEDSIYTTRPTRDVFLQSSHIPLYPNLGLRSVQCMGRLTPRYRRISFPWKKINLFP